jgi:hypothetical protein
LSLGRNLLVMVENTVKHEISAGIKFHG